MDDNERTLKALAEAVRKGAIAFVGAGSSATAGYPTWGGFLGLMADEVERRAPSARELLDEIRAESDVLWQAEEYRRLLGEQAFELLMRRTFGPEDPRHHEFHEKLVLLPWKHVITTNYDAVLEAAHVSATKTAATRVLWSDAADLGELLAHINDGSFQRRYVYLHGRFNDPSGVIISERDYVARYDDAASIANLYSIVATQTLVFWGFSLNDLDLLEAFRSVVSAAPTSPRHFAVVPLQKGNSGAAQRRRLNDKFGIQPVFYPLTDDHAGMRDLCARLLDDPTITKSTSRPGVVPSERSTREAVAASLKLSDLATSILVESVPGWEVTLFSRVLSDELSAAQALRQDFALEVSLGPLEHLDNIDLLQRVQVELSALLRIPALLAELVNVQFPLALGPSGTPADARGLVQVARRIGEAYRNSIEWGLRWRRLHVEEQLERLVEIFGRMVRGIVDGLETFECSMATAAASIVGGPLAATTFDFTLNLTIPLEWENELQLEIERVGRALAKPDA